MCELIGTTNVKDRIVNRSFEKFDRREEKSNTRTYAWYAIGGVLVVRQRKEIGEQKNRP